MNPIRWRRHQRGATLIVSLIMLAVITLLVVTAFSLSSTNLKSVGNMQFRDEAISAANMAIEEVLTGFSSAPPTQETINVDLNNDGITDYVVSITPTCIKSSVVADGDGLGKQGDVELGPALSVGAGGTTGGYLTVWDFDATVTDAINGGTGVKVRVHQGVRKLLASLPSSCT